MTIDLPQEATDLLPDTTPDGSGVAVNFVDAISTALTDAVPDISITRTGLRLSLVRGKVESTTLLDRHTDGPDVVSIVDSAFARLGAGVGLEVHVTATELTITGE